MGTHGPDKRQVSISANIHELKSRQLAGRAGVIAAVSVFIGLYAYGIAEYGVFLGVAFGWLPCGMAAWMTAIAVSRFGLPVARYTLKAPGYVPHARMAKSGVHQK